MKTFRFGDVIYIVNDDFYVNATGRVTNKSTYGQWGTMPSTLYYVDFGNDIGNWFPPENLELVSTSIIEELPPCSDPF